MKHIIGFSGGVDSQACALWARQRFPHEDIILLNADAGGNEHPITVDFIAQYSANVFPVATAHAQVQDLFGKGSGKIRELNLQPTDPLTFDLLAQIKDTFPRRKMQFCTDHLKLYPARRWHYENGARGLNEPRTRRDKSVYRPYGDAPQLDGILGEGYERYVGIRRDESLNRSKVEDRVFDDTFMCWLNRPIASWSKAECFQFLKDNHEEWNPLYDFGFTRVGCAPCVNSGKRDIRMWAAFDNGKMIDKVREWETTTGKSFFGPIMPDGHSGTRWGWVDEVVEWSRTTHGGDQYELPMLEADVDSGMCSNHYGFC